MASGTAPSPSQGQSVRVAVGPYETLIDQRLRVTRRHVKSVDVTVGLMVLAIGSLAYLMAVALADHWLAKGGLGFAARLTLLAAWLAAAGLYFARVVLPSLWHRVNPVFAARTIEQSQPTLKNSLINFLLLRTSREQVAPAIYQALEHRAAADLTQVPVDAVVDRSRIVRLGYVLSAVVAAACLYLAFSPKNPLVSFERLLLPWADIPVPSRVKIDRVEPGDFGSFQGEFVPVSAEVSGLKAGEQVLLYFGTADGEVVDQTIPMTVPEGGYRQRCVLPPGSRGLQQDLWYFLAAGDARSRRYKIEAQINPIITVDRVDYHYPPYTGIPDRSVEREGDIHAIEGTEITIHTSANQEIARAEIDLDCKGVGGLPMQVRGDTANGQFTLRMKADEPASPEHREYQLHFVDRHNRENRKPIRYRIEVLRDLPPDVQIVEPQEENIQLAENGQLEFRVRASDPDFGLRRVALRAEKEKRGLAIAPLLNKLRPEPAHKGEFVGSYLFAPQRLRLKAGDQVTYWAEAEDNKGDDETPPAPNRSETVKRWITIVAAGQSPAGQQPKEANRDARSGQEGNDQNPPQKHDKSDKSDGGKPAKEQQSPQDKSSEQQAQKEHQGMPGKGEPQKDPQGEPGNSKDQKSGDSADQKGQSQQGEGASKPNNQAGRQPQGSNGKDSQQTQSKDQPAGDKSTDQSKAKNEPVDPETDPGTAFEKILDRAQPGKQDQGKKDQQQLASNNPQQQPGEQKDSQSKQQSGGSPQQQQQQQQPGQQKDNQNKQQSGGSPQQQQQQPGQQKDNQNKQQSGGSPQQQQQQPGAQKDSQNKQQSSGSPQQQQQQQQQPGEQKDSQNKQQSGGSPQQQQQQPGAQKDSQNKQQSSGSPQQQQQQPGAQKDSQSKQQSSGSPQQQQQQPGEQKDSQNKQQSGGSPQQQQQQPGAQKDSQSKQQAGQPGADQQKGQSGGSQQQQSAGAEKSSGGTSEQKQGQPSGAKATDMAQKGANDQPGDKKPSDSASQPDAKASPSGQKNAGDKSQSVSKTSDSTSQPADQKAGTSNSAQTTGGDKNQLAQRPQDSQGPQAMSAPERGQQSPGESAQNKPGQQKEGQREDSSGKSGSGTGSDQAKDSREPQGSNRSGDKKTGQSGDAGKGGQGDKANSPSSSPQNSNTQSAESGDRSGKGKPGGGAQSKQQGTGSAGANTPADQGGSPSAQKGEGDTGNKSGDQAKSESSTGNGPKAAGQGMDSQGEPGKGKAEGGASKSTDSAQSGKAGDNSAKQSADQGGGAMPNGGGQAGPSSDASPPPATEAQRDEANLEFANKQTDLALEYLRDELAKEKPDPELLKQLDWSKETLQRFYDRWMEMKRAAGQEPPGSTAARQRYLDAVKSLGLSPHVEGAKSGTTQRDQLQGMHEQRRIAAPPGWGDILKSYTEGISEQK